MGARIYVTVLAAAATLGAGPAYADKWGDQFPHIARTGDIPGPCSYEAMSQKDYSGRTLSISTHAIPVMGEPTALHAEQFSKLTGAEVNVVHTPFGDLFQKTMVPLQTGQAPYDVMFGGSYWIGDWIDYIEPVPEKYINMPQMQDVTRNYLDVASWKGQMVQFPVDGDRHYLKYRRDIIDNPEMQARYKKDTGHVLQVPRTWKEYAEIATYFNGWDWDGDGEPEYGSAEIVARDDLMFSAFISRVAAYAKNPRTPGGFFFDLKTMEPLINTPGWVQGLQNFVDAKEYMPPGGENFGLGDEIFSFGGGQTLFSYSWDDAFVQAQQDDSPIKNKVGAAPLPGAEKVWNRLDGSWDNGYNYAPYITWGWGVAVAKQSKNKDMAFDYLCFFANPANHAADLRTGRFGVNPYRKVDFDPNYYIENQGWDKTTAQTYTATLSGMEASTNRVFDLRVPGVNQFYTAMATAVSEAMAGQKTPQQALDDAAEEWKKIVQRLGVEKVRDAYSAVVALEDNQL
jgi:multiple sugar transport system substrate-binding protein